MGSPTLVGKVLRFGVFELNPEAQQLRRAGVVLRIQPQPLKVLIVLASRPGKVVTREELRHTLWGDQTFVDFEQGLNYCIRQIRAVLGDEAQTPRYVETVPRSGYRFIAPVEGLGEAAGSGAVPNSARRRSGLSPRVQWAVAAALLMAGIAATLYFLHQRASHRFGEKDTVVLAEFTNTTGNPAYDVVLKEALAIQLEQTPFLNVLSSDRVAATAKLMNRSGERVTPEIAREVCLRTNSRAMLVGTIAAVGSHYFLGMRAVDCQSGDTLASAQEEAENSDKILYALQRAGNQLRQNLGESLSSLSRYNAPLPEATTSSLEALEAYSAARATARPEALAYLQRAVQLDPNFALAWAGLGARYDNFGQHGLAMESYKRAYDLRDRVSVRERFYIEAHYFQGFGGSEKADQIYTQWIQDYPRDFTPYGNLANNYANMGFYEKAVVLNRQALQLSPDFPTFMGNLEEDYLNLGLLDEARALFQQAISRGADGIVLHAARYGVAFLENDQAAMQQQVTWAMGKPGAEDWLLSAESDTAASSGRLAAAHDFSQRAVESARRSGAAETAALWEMNEALRLAEFGYPDQARSAVARALGLASESNVKLLAALALARSGDLSHARTLADTLNGEFPAHTLIQSYWLPTIRAAVDLELGNPAHAIEGLQPSTTYELGSTELFQLGTMYPVYIRGLAYLKSGQPQQAAAEFQKIFDHRGVIVNFPLAPLAHLQYARAQLLNHRSGEARKGYQDFLALWKDADPGIPILKQAKAEFARLP